MKTPRAKPGTEDTLQIAATLLVVVAVLSVSAFLFRDPLRIALNKLIGKPEGQPAQLRVFQPEAAPADARKEEAPKKGVYIVARPAPQREQQPVPDLNVVRSTASLFAPPLASATIRVKRDPLPSDVRPGAERNEILARFAPPSLRASTMQNGDMVETFVYRQSAQVHPTVVLFRNGTATGVE
jgi:hypothetical protein